MCAVEAAGLWHFITVAPASEHSILEKTSVEVQTEATAAAGGVGGRARLLPGSQEQAGLLLPRQPHLYSFIICFWSSLQI